MKKLIDVAIAQMKKESWQEWEETALRISLILNGQIGFDRVFPLENTKLGDVYQARNQKTIDEVIQSAQMIAKSGKHKVEIHKIMYKIKRISGL